MGPDPAQTLVVATWSPNHTDPQQVTRFLPHLEVHQDATWKASRPATHTAHDRLALASLAPTVHKAWNAHLLAFHRSVKSPAMLEYDFAWERHLFGLSLAISAVNVDQNTLTRRSIVTPHDLASFAQSVRHEHGGV